MNWVTRWRKFGQTKVADGGKKGVKMNRMCVKLVEESRKDGAGEAGDEGGVVADAVEAALGSGGGGGCSMAVAAALGRWRRLQQHR